MFPHISLCETNGPRGHNLNKIGRGLLDDTTTYQIQGSHGQGKMKKIKVREKSGNFEFSQGNLKFWQKSGNFKIKSRSLRTHVIKEMNDKNGYGSSFNQVKDNVIHNMAWWLKSAGALNFALSQEQCPISL